MRYLFFLLFLPSLLFSQTTKEFTKNIEGSGYANEGYYNYEAKIKYQLWNQGLGDIVLKIGIIDFKITRFRDKNMNEIYSTSSPVADQFPIVLNNHQADVRFNLWIEWKGGVGRKIVSLPNLKEEAVRQGSLDLYYFSKEQVEEMVDKFELKANRNNIEGLDVKISSVYIDNDYFGELASISDEYYKSKNEALNINSGDKSKNNKRYNSHVDNERKIVEASLKGAEARYKREQEFAKIEAARKARESKPSDAFWFDSPAKRAALEREQNAASEQNLTKAVEGLANTLDAAFKENGKRRAAKKQAEREQRFKEEKRALYDDAKKTYREGIVKIAGEFHNGIALVNPTIYDDILKNINGSGYYDEVAKTYNTYFFIDKQGRNVFGKSWEKAYEFHNGLAKVCIDGYSKCNYIDLNGNYISTKFYYDVPEKFEGKFTKVENNDNYGYINRSGKEIIPPIYNELGEFNEGLAYAKKNEKYGYINTLGNVVVPFKYSNALDFNNGRAIVKTDDNQIIIDTKGNFISKLDFDEVYEYRDGMARVRIRTSPGWYGDGRNIKYGYIDKSGNLTILPIYKLADDFSDGLASVRIDEKDGYIDKSGKTVIPFVHDVGWWFINGYARITKRGDYTSEDVDGLINKKNEFIIPFDKNYSTVGYPSEGLVQAKKNGRWGYIDLNNNIIIPFKYFSASKFENGTATVTAPVKFMQDFVIPAYESEKASEPWIIDIDGRCVKDCINKPKGF